MSIVECIEAVAKSKGLTFKSLERECGLGNGTIKRWERQSPRLDKLLKVAEYLHISLDDLVSANSRTEIKCDGIPLTESETDLIAMVRLIDEADKQTIFELAKLKYEMKTGEKVSSYLMYPDVIARLKSGSVDGKNTAHETA